MNDPIVALIYLRAAVSDDEAISRQRRACLDHAAAQGWVVIDVFADNGASGLSGRDGFNALRGRVKTGQTDIVLMQDPSRISRDPSALAAFRRLCDDHEVRLAFTSGHVIDQREHCHLAETLDAARLRAAWLERQDR